MGSTLQLAPKLYATQLMRRSRWDRRRFSRGRRWPLGLEVLEGWLAQDGGSPRPPERCRTRPEHNLARLEGAGPQERWAASVSGWVLARWVGSSPRRRALLRLRAQSKS